MSQKRLSAVQRNMAHRLEFSGCIDYDNANGIEKTVLESLVNKGIALFITDSSGGFWADKTKYQQFLQNIARAAAK